MFKKLQRNIVFLFMIFIIPLTIGKVDCAWVYYEGSALGTSTYVDFTLGKFNFITYPNEYPSTPEGIENQNSFDKIFGGESSKGDVIPEHSLQNRGNAINNALSKDSMTKERNFVTSEDYIKDVDGKYVNAKDYIYGAGNYANTSFVIERDIDTYDNGGILRDQVYYVYTTTVDISKLSIGDIVYPVFRTKLTWNFMEADGGYKVHTDGNTIGYCKVANVDMRDSNGKFTNSVKFFKHNPFTAKYLGETIGNSIKIKNSGEYSTISPNNNGSNPVYYKLTLKPKKSVNLRITSNNNGKFTITNSIGHVTGNNTSMVKITNSDRKTITYTIEVYGLNSTFVVDFL